MRIRWVIRLTVMLLCLAPVWRATAQEITECSTLAQTALVATQDACHTLEAGQACYGHSNVRATAYPQTTDFHFESSGDFEAITDIAFLKTDVADVLNGLWGIARMDFEALVPATSEADTVTLLMLGDVEITNSFKPELVVATVNASSNVNVRNVPTTTGSVMGVIAPGDTVGIVGRNADSTWLHIRTDNFEGWLLQDFVEFDNNTPRAETIAALTDITQGTLYEPMQAFLMRSNDTHAGCAEIPESGVIIQTRTGENLVNLLVNAVSITFDSTIHLQTRTQADTTQLTISVLEGETQIEAQNVAQFARSGQAISVELDEDSIAAGTPAIPIPLDPAVVNALPVTLLPRHFCVPIPYQPPPSVAASLDTNLSGVNLDELEPFGTPNPEQLGNMGWIRLNYNVSDDIGSLDLEAAYDRYQPLLEQYAESGYQTIVVITHQTYGEKRSEFPPWPEMTDAQWRLLSDNLAKTACQIAKQYANQELVSVYQIWNEQDTTAGARAGIPVSIENYAYMLTKVSTAIRAVDPNALIITGGHVGGPGNGAHYARQMVSLLPTTDLVDGIALHPYGRGVDFGSPYRVFGHIDVSIQAYSNILPGKPVWITEWGVLDRPLDPTAEIAEYAMSMLNYVDKWYGDRVAAMVWYAWAEGMDNGYGLVDSSEKPKPDLYEQFTTFVAQRIEVDAELQEATVPD